jgi:hypothetical protein
MSLGEWTGNAPPHATKEKPKLNAGPDQQHLRKQHQQADKPTTRNVSKHPYKTSAGEATERPHVPPQV